MLETHAIAQAAKGMIQNGQVDEGTLNKVEMAFRAYDPCHGCATHALSGPGALQVRIHGTDGRIIRTLGKQ